MPFFCLASPPQIATSDPVEVDGARKVAIAHVCIEIVVTVMFCTSAWCGLAMFIAAWSSGLVACCFKTRTAYLLWSLVGVLLFALHAIAAVAAVVAQDDYDYVAWPPAIVVGMQIILCGVCLHVVHTGCKTASAIKRQAICPVESQIGTPLQMSTHPVVVNDAQ